MLKPASFGDWSFTVDRKATECAYAAAKCGGVDTCNCAGCRNFRLARERVFPSEFKALLAGFGIDPRKDGEIYHAGQRAPGNHIYVGWYHFIGTLEKTGDFPTVFFGADFQVWLLRA